MFKQLGLLALVALSQGAAAASAPASECADVLIITTRGSTEYEPDPATIAADSAQVVERNSTTIPMQTGEGEMSLIAIGVQKNTTSLTIERQAVIYPAVDDSPTSYQESFTNGTVALVKIIKEATKQCKDQKLVLMGFSQGAHVVGDVLSGPGGGIWGDVEAPELDPETYSKQIAAIVLWGDPRHNQKDQESFTVGFPAATEDGYFARTTNQTDILKKYYSDRIVSYCTDKDKYCSSGLLGTNMVAANNESENIHIFSYMTSSVDPAMAFIQEHIKDIKPSKSGSSSESGATTNATSTKSGSASGTSSATASASGKSAASHLKYSMTGILAVIGVVACQILM